MSIIIFNGMAAMYGLHGGLFNLKNFEIFDIINYKIKKGDLCMWEDDICWCMDSETCTNYECFRHLTHMDKPGIFTCSHLRNTDYCPLEKESED